MKILRNKKGVTIVEVVVAMTIVTIITIAAVTLLGSSINNTRTTQYKNDAQYFASDVVECFRAAKNAENFNKLIEFRGGYETKNAVDAETTEYILFESGYTAIIYVNNSGLITLTVTVKDNDENTVVEKQFEKAVSSWN